MSIKFSPKTQIRVLTPWYKIQPQTIESTRLHPEPNIVCVKNSIIQLIIYDSILKYCRYVFFDFALTRMSTLILRTRSLWWPQTRASVAKREEGGNVYRFWPDTGVSDVRWTRGCDQNHDITGLTETPEREIFSPQITVIVVKSSNPYPDWCL